MTAAFRISAIGVATVFLAATANAEGLEGSIAVELNAAQSNDTGCLVSFLVTNTLGQDIDSLIFETVLLNAAGQVDRLTLFDFGALPQNRPRVRRFALDGTSCESFGAILINGAQTCSVAGDASTSCDAHLSLTSRVEMDLLG